MNTVIKDTVALLEAEVQRAHEEYVKLHEELDKHRGKVIEETDLPAVNSLLKEIQHKMAELHPALNFVAIRHQYAINITNHYNEFIETLKKGGAIEEQPTGQS